MRKTLLAALLLSILASTSCVKVVAPPPPTSGGGDAPRIVSFVADPSSIYTGGTSALKWEVTNAGSVNINQGIGPVALKGNSSAAPSSTTTYTLTATNRYGSSTATAQVIVMGPPPAGNPSSFNLPVVAVFSVEPANIVSGSTAVLRWDVQNSFDVEIEPGPSIISPKGTREVSPPFLTTYKLTARNAQGSILATTTLTVSGTPPDAETPLIKYFKADAYVIKRGESTILSWESMNGSSASIDKGVGTIDGSGTVRVIPETTTTYMLTVVNARGGQFQTVTVNVR
jgi:hypothetical protein